MTHLGLVIQSLDQNIYPGDKPKLQKKIRSLVRLSDGQLQSLYAELFFSKYLVRRFAPIRLEPSIPGTKRKADFLVHYDGEPVVFDVSKLVIQELVEWASVQWQLVQAVGRMAFKGDLLLEVEAVFDFVPRSSQTDAVIAAVRSGLQELIASGGNEINLAVNGEGGVWLAVNHPVEVKQGDERWAQGKYGSIVRRGSHVSTRGYLAMLPSINTDVVARLVAPRLNAKIERTARDKLRQRQRGKPFVLVLNLDSVPGAHENLQVVRDMIVGTLRRHPKLSAVALFKWGTPYYKQGNPDKWGFLFAEYEHEAALPGSFFDYFAQPFGADQPTSS